MNQTDFDKMPLGDYEELKRRIIRSCKKRMHADPTSAVTFH